ncbi:MAG TPA: sigma-70 family RNA polymerase sigma factor [Vicinamibacterales bacterium]|nr:sigma-70 family RNA polymerase sigma factor [Vicinamibacterales bacterium]
MDPDRALVEAAAAGSREAFDELVRRHQAAMITLARVLTSGRGDAEDLAQEVFVRAWRNLKRFRGDSAFRTWLHRVAINVVRTSQTRQGRLTRLFSSLGGAEHGEPSREPPAPDEPFDAVLARRQLIDRALATLPDDLRVAVTLRDLQGMDYREIAAVLDLPIGTVESRIFRARQRLKPLLAPLFRP